MKTLRGPTIVSVGYQAPVVPVNTAAPVASGSLTVGSVLSCTTGTWSNSPTSYAYRWQRDGANISGAVASTYTVVTADIGGVLTCNVTATNSYGSTVATSNARGPIVTSMPSGALLLLYADQYDAAKKCIPNAINAASPISANIFRASRRLFSQAEHWVKLGTGTITDDAAAGPDGAENDATNLNMSAGNWGIHPTTQVPAHSVPAGTYTLCVSAKSNTGGNQTFAFSKDNTATRSTVKTATTSWQNFTYVFTLASPISPAILYLCSDAAAGTAANILIRDFELHPGDVSATWTHQPYVGHAYMGHGLYDTRVTSGTGYVDISTGGWGYVQLAATSAISSTGITAIGLVSRVAAGTAYEAYLSKVGAAEFGKFTAYSSQSDMPVDFTGIKFSEAPTATALWQTQGAGYHCFGHRYDGTNRDLWLDDLRVNRKATTVADFNIRDFFTGIVNSTNLTSGYRIVAIGLWPRALTDAEYRTVVNEFLGRAVASGLTAAPVARFVAFEGDSRTASINTRWPFVFGPNASPAVFGVNLALSGSTLANLQARIALVTGIAPPAGVGAGRKFICVVGQQGINDLATYTGGTDAIAAQNYANAMGVYTDALYAGHASNVVVCTEPASGNATVNTRRALVNNIYKTAYPGTNPVLLAKFDEDAIMGPDNSFTANPTYWVDSTHQSALGDGRYEPIVRPVINGI
jgi:hypothetical protein